MRKIWKAGGAPLIASAAVATTLVGTATSAMASHTLTVADTAELLAKGAAISLPVEVSCDGSFKSIWVTVAEKAANRLATGTGSQTTSCDGDAQTFEIVVRAKDVAFKSGTALATVTVYTCDPTCHDVSETKEIRVRH